jgi:hypothetical protein
MVTGHRPTAGLIVAVMMAACGTEPATVCTAPPVDELAQESALVLTLEPNPVAPGSEAVLSLSAEGLGLEALVGAGLEWQCWDGAGWVATHQVVRESVTIEVVPGETTTVPAVGYTVPTVTRIVVPEVGPGVYRLVDRAYTGNREVSGFVFVEVR